MENKRCNRSVASPSQIGLEQLEMKINVLAPVAFLGSGKETIARGDA